MNDQFFIADHINGAHNLSLVGFKGDLQSTISSFQMTKVLGYCTTGFTFDHRCRLDIPLTSIPVQNVLEGFYKGIGILRCEGGVGS